MFFATIILKLQDSTEKSSEVAVLQSLRSIIVGSSSTAGTTTVLDLNVRSDIEFGCNAIRIGSSENQFQHMMVFGPRAFDGGQLIVKTLSLGHSVSCSNTSVYDFSKSTIHFHWR